MSLAEGYKRNYKKEKGNQYCDHNMTGDHNTDMGTNTVMYCTKPLSTIQCNKTLCQDQLDPYYS